MKKINSLLATILLLLTLTGCAAKPKGTYVSNSFWGTHVFKFNEDQVTYSTEDESYKIFGKFKLEGEYIVITWGDGSVQRLLYDKKNNEILDNGATYKKIN